MRSFPALIAPDDQADPPVQVNLYASPQFRDQQFDRHRRVSGVRSADLRLSELSDAELAQARLLVKLDHPEFPVLLQAYLTEKISRLKAMVEADVEVALADETPVAPNDMIWAMPFGIAGATFAIGFDGHGQIARNVAVPCAIEEPDIERLVQRTSALILRKVLPALQRLTPRPTFIAGGSNGR
jgi:hypothetical protein